MKKFKGSKVKKWNIWKSEKDDEISGRGIFTRKKGSGALSSGKMLLVNMEIIKLMIILGQVNLSIIQPFLARLETPAGAIEMGKNTTSNHFQ